MATGSVPTGSVPSGGNGTTGTSATRVLVRVVVYYVLLAAAGFVLWRIMPHTRLVAGGSLSALFGKTGEPLPASGAAVPVQGVDQGSVAVLLAMVSAALLALPVAWIYTLTRARRGYQQSVVQLLVMLPVVVAGIVVLVKYSLALAFSLGGIAAAVRFRNTLDDSKDAVYVFLVIGIGLSSAVDLPVAMVLSVIFNVVIVCLWITDFGRTPVALDGKLAERRLARARQLARTGTFVARIDDEVLREMSAEQLEGIAARALRRAREHDPEGGESPKAETRIRLVTHDVMTVRAVIEARLDESTKKWAVSSTAAAPDNATIIEYVVQLKKNKGPDELLALVRAAAGRQLVSAELL